MRNDHSSFDFYRERLQVLEKSSEIAPAFVASEVLHLATTFFRAEAPRLALAELEQDLAVASDCDVEALAKALLVLNVPNNKPITLTEERTLDPAKVGTEFQQFLQELRQAQSTTHQRSVLWRLEMTGDRLLMALLICANASGVDVSTLVETARLKLIPASDLVLARLWGRIQIEFDPLLDLPHFDSSSSLVPLDFLTSGTADDVRQKIAQYTFVIRPALVVEGFSKRQYTYPLEALGPARLLAANTTASPLDNDPMRLDLVRRVARIAALWKKLPGGAAIDLSQTMRVLPGSRLLSGTDAQDAERELSDVAENNLPRVACHELNALLITLEHTWGAGSPVVTALLRYKLGLEVTLPESAISLKECSELQLQKRACQFLLERGLYAEGTKFGPFETDLVALVRSRTTVVEVKLNPADSPPTIGSIRAGLAQLQDYMDKRPVRPQGVLLIYNFSSVLLVGPNRWLRGRYWITAINLGESTGSKRRRTIVLEEGANADLVVSYELPKSQTTSE